jgi:hypothetical protein
MIESEEEIEVKKWKHKGVMYYIDEATNDVYDIKTEELVGRYNKTKDIIRKAEKEEEEEDEEEKQMKEERRREKEKIEAMAKRMREKDEKDTGFKKWFYKGIVHYKNKDNYVLDQLTKPVGIYRKGKIEPMTDEEKRKLKEIYEIDEEEDEEDLDAMIDELDAEIEAMFVEDFAL